MSIPYRQACLTIYFSLEIYFIPTSTRQYKKFITLFNRTTKENSHLTSSPFRYPFTINRKEPFLLIRN